jgi:hypothetical protein
MSHGVSNRIVFTHRYYDLSSRILPSLPATVTSFFPLSPIDSKKPASPSCYTTTETGETAKARHDRSRIQLCSRQTFTMPSTLPSRFRALIQRRWYTGVPASLEGTSSKPPSYDAQLFRERRDLWHSRIASSLFADRARIVAGEEPTRVACIATDLEAAKAETAPVSFPDLHAYRSFEGIHDCGGLCENWVTQQNQLHMLEFEAQSMIHRIAPTPLLMVVPGNDRTVLTLSQLIAFGKAREPKQLVYLEAAGHFDIYRGDFSERNIEAQIEFLKSAVLDV